MGAPKGNNYWQFRNKHGRDFIYTPDAFWDEAVKYFEWMKDKVWNKKDPIKSGDMAGTLIDVPTQTPMSITSFCLFADIDENTFQRYEKEEGYEDFWAITKAIKAVIESQQFEGATVGAFNPNIIARKLGLADHSDIKSGGEKIQNPSIISVEIVKPNEDTSDTSISK